MLRRSSSTVVLGLVLGVFSVPGCKKKKEDASAADTSGSKELVLRSKVAGELGSSSFGVVGEVVRGDRRAIVVWPGLTGDKQPASLVAFVFTQAGETWTPVGGKVELPRGGSADVLGEALGGKDGQQVVRDCGLPPDELTEHLRQHGAAFARALEAGDSSSASATYEELARAFAWDHVALTTMLLDLLVSPAPKTWYCGGKGCTVETDWEGRRRLHTFAHADCGGGKVVGEALASQP